MINPSWETLPSNYPFFTPGGYIKRLHRLAGAVDPVFLYEWWVAFNTLWRKRGRGALRWRMRELAGLHPLYPVPVLDNRGEVWYIDARVVVANAVIEQWDMYADPHPPAFLNSIPPEAA